MHDIALVYFLPGFTFMKQFFPWSRSHATVHLEEDLIDNTPNKNLHQQPPC